MNTKYRGKEIDITGCNNVICYNCKYCSAGFCDAETIDGFRAGLNYDYTRRGRRKIKHYYRRQWCLDNQTKGGAE